MSFQDYALELIVLLKKCTRILWGQFPVLIDLMGVVLLVQDSSSRETWLRGLLDRRC